MKAFFAGMLCGLWALGASPVRETQTQAFAFGSHRVPLLRHGLNISLPEFQHPVHNAGELMSHCRDRLRRSQFSPQSSEIGPQPAMASKQPPGRHP
jgi:hypothetical protein